MHTTARHGTARHVDVHLLGGFDAVVDGRPVPERAWRRRAAATLVKLLALQPGRRLRRERVIDALWPDLLLDEAGPRLHTAAHYARTALGVRDAVVLAGDVVSLLPAASVTVDADEFAAAADEALAAGSPGAARTVLDGYRGDLLPDDVYEVWAEEPRLQHRRRYLDLLRTAGRWSQLAEADPLDEEAHLRVAEEHLRSGRRSAALRQLSAMDEVFRRELGVDSGRAAAALRARVLALPEGTPPGAADWATPVPVPSTQTIGREHDLRQVLSLLDRARIVTLLGPGGVGKTRLAVEAVRRRSEAVGVDSCFVDLTKACRADVVPEVIAGELGVRTSAAVDPERSIAAALRGRSVLVVLDNVEHVVDAAGVIGRLVARVPGLQVVCTSRARLRLSGEHVHDVAPLPVDPPRALHPAGAPPAVALFAQAARSVDPGFRLADHLPEVVGICRAVDGLPLAIELAAGHLRTLPPGQLRRRLSARLGSPSGGTRDSHPRQQTVAATIDWSLQLLGPAERRLFRRLGVFTGAVPLELVEQVCADGDDDVVESLSRLVDQSLVRRLPGRGGAPRYRLLTLLRERARALLTPEEAARLRRRHAAVVTAALERIDERRWAGTGGWIDEIDELLLEIRVAHREAELRGDWTTAARITAALGAYWHREGHHAEGREWAEAALAHAAGLPDLLVARLQLAAGVVTWTTHARRARRHWECAVVLSRRAGSPRYLACGLALSAAGTIGNAELYPEARRLADEAVALARQVGEGPLLAQALNISGELSRVHGELEAARAAYEEGREVAARAHDDTHVAMLVSNLGYLAVERGDPAEGRRLKREALSLAWSSGRRMVATWFVSELAAPELALGRPRLAAVLVGAADQALLRLGAARAPGDRPEHERVLRGLRAALGDAGLRRLREEGAALPLEEAVRLALCGPEDGAGAAPCAAVRSAA
jgi:predicted ATPase/DNA-binding SARP family transcriptional activator